VFEKWMLGENMCTWDGVTVGRRKLNNDIRPNLSWSIIIGMTNQWKWDSMNIQHGWDKRNAYKVLVVRNLDTDVLEKARRIWVNNIMTNLKDSANTWIGSSGSGHGRVASCLHRVVKLWIVWNEGNFSTGWRTVSFWRTTLRC
jgi:hypothetical protein